MEESRIILKSTLVDIIANCRKFSKALDKVKDNSALFVVAGVDEGNPSRMLVAVAGAKEVISQTIAEAMCENPEIAKMLLYAGKIFMDRKIKKVVDKPFTVDNNGLFDILDNAFGEKQCDCPDCRGRRRREGN